MIRCSRKAIGHSSSPWFPSFQGAKTSVKDQRGEVLDQIYCFMMLIFGALDLFDLRLRHHVRILLNALYSLYRPVSFHN